MLKLISEVSLGAFAAANLVVGQTPPVAWEDWLQKLGALGLCAFMVFQNYRQQDALAKVVASKDNQIVELMKQSAEERRQATAALKELSAALHGRPCIMHDPRIEHPKIEGDPT